MSLILEALKKSEHQRRLGESPSLGSPVMAVRRRRSLLPVLAVLIALGLVALWWMQREPAAPETGADVAATTPITAKASPSPAPATPAPATPVAAAPRANPAPPPAQKQAAVPAPALDGQSSQREKLRSGELVAANPQAGAAATIKESAAVSAADPAALAAAMANAQKSAAVEAPTARTKAADLATKPAAAPATQSGSATPPPDALAKRPDDALKLMWELPLATRRSLPEIKLSMHVFATDPAQRFVIVNGERRAEGDDFDGLKLVEIRSDGVVLEAEGVRFLYPRGGR